MWTPEDIRKTIAAHKILVFGKGTKDQPMCGFTMRAIEILRHCDADFEVVNIFEDPGIKEALVQVSGWPTTPQIFIGGEFIGGSDIALEMYQKGELQAKIRELDPA